MKKIISTIILLLILISTVTLVFNIQPVKTETAVIIVPDDYPTIQMAINAATPGCTILVSEGTYSEGQINVTKPLKLLSKGRVILNGLGKGHVFSVISDRVTISGFIISNPSASDWKSSGVFVSGHECTISYNEIVHCVNGILLFGDGSNFVIGNTIKENQRGIYIYESNKNNFTGNRILKNGIGIEVKGWNNTFYYNYFVGNEIQVESYGFDNTWDDGSLFGNYWSDYTGLDNNWDGVGDSPYIIDEKNIDKYPLIWTIALPNIFITGIVKAIQLNYQDFSGWFSCNITALITVKITEIMLQMKYCNFKVGDTVNVSFNYTDLPRIDVGDVVEVFGSYFLIFDQPMSFTVAVAPETPFSYIKSGGQNENLQPKLEIVEIKTNDTQIFIGDRFHINVLVKNTGNTRVYIYPVTYTSSFTPEDSVRYISGGPVDFFDYIIIDPGQSTYLTDPVLFEFDAWEAVKSGIISYNFVIYWGYELDQEGIPILDQETSKTFTFTIYSLQTYVLHVQSYPITGVSISYSGDYSGTGTTNFDVGPKEAPFTVTLKAPLIHGDHKFSHWLLDGVNMGQSNTLTVKVDDEKMERTTVAVYSPEQSLKEINIVSFSVDKKTKCYTIGKEPIKFNVTLHNKMPSNVLCWVRIKILSPTPDKDKGYSQIVDTDPIEVVIPAQRDVSKIITWNAPASYYPGTVIAIAQVFDSNPNEAFSHVISNKMLLLMLEKTPDISYVEIFGTEDHKVIHVHLQPYAFCTPFEHYYDWVTFWTAVDVVSEFNLIAFIELLKRAPTYMQKAINLASSEPYDLTIFQIYDQVGFAFEEAPATLLESTLTEVALYIGWELAKKKLGLEGGIPRPPLENFIPIPKEFLEQPAPFYSQLHVPLMMNVEWLTPIPGSIERGRTIEIRVKASDPETKEPLDGATVHAIIGPEVSKYTRPTLFLWQTEKGVYSTQYYFSEDCQTGFWTIQVMANAPPKNGKRGFLGLSPVKSIFVKSEISPIDITTLNIKAEPLTIGREEFVKITVDCTIFPSQIQSYKVRVAVWEKRSFLLIFSWDNKLREDEGSLSSVTQLFSKTYVFEIKGSELGWDLGPFGKRWVIGEHMLYATIYVSWTPPDSTYVRHIERTSYCVSVTVTGDEEPVNANIIVLTEKGQKLYLNVYDSKGRRVGFDNISNSTIIEIPGAYYNHGTNWILIMLPPDVSDFRCIIDGKSAHETIEEYNLTIASIRVNGTKMESVSGSIEKGKIFEVEAKVTDDNIFINPRGFVEERSISILLLISIIIGVICVVSVIVVIRVRVKKQYSRKLIRKESLFV